MISNREIDLELSTNFEKNPNVLKTKLSVNEDTSYDIYYDVCEFKSEKYFYMKMIENTADAPFYFNRSYTQEDLCKIHKIFKANDINETKDDIKSLFEKQKIKLIFDQNEEMINMELDTMLFADNYKINFTLYKEMIPKEDKDKKLIDLYSLNKNKLKILKEIYACIHELGGNQNDIKIYEHINQLFISKEIPGIEKINCKKPPIIEKTEKKVPKIEKTEEKKLVNNELDDSEIGKKRERKQSRRVVCKISKLSAKYLLKKGNKNNCINLLLVNIYDEEWIPNKIKLECDEDGSTIKPCQIEYPFWDISKGQDGEFNVKFDKDIERGNHKCILYLYINGNKKEDSKIELNIKVK